VNPYQIKEVLWFKERRLVDISVGRSASPAPTAAPPRSVA
jgi:hypothetical protein